MTTHLNYHPKKLIGEMEFFLNDQLALFLLYMNHSSTIFLRVRDIVLEIKVIIK